MAWLIWVVSNVLLAVLPALAAWFVQRRLRWHGVARVLWLLVLIKLVTPPLIRVPVHGTPGMLACAVGVCGCERHALPTLVRDPLPWILLVAWSAGAAATACVAFGRVCWFRRLLTHVAPAPLEWQELAGRLGFDLS